MKALNTKAWRLIALVMFTIAIVFSIRTGLFIYKHGLVISHTDAYGIECLTVIIRDESYRLKSRCGDKEVDTSGVHPMYRRAHWIQQNARKANTTYIDINN